MSRNGQRLAIVPGSLLDRDLAAYIEAWPRYQERGLSRSVWLTDVEHRLELAFPDASRADLNLTARSIAPFFLSEGPNVP